MDSLLVDEFLRSVMMSNSNVSVDVLESKTEISHPRTEEPSQEMLQVMMKIFIYFLFIGGFTATF